MEKQKYVKLKEYGVFIIFSPLIPHNEFKRLEIVSAGFCHIDTTNKVVHCYGESIGLSLKSDSIEDTKKATLQIFGTDAFLEYMKKNNS